MPELPEVETVRRGLQPVMEGAKIVKAEARRKDLRFPFQKDFIARLTGQVGKVSLYFNPTVITLPAAIQGIDVRAPDADVTWNLYTWTLR